MKKIVALLVFALGVVTTTTAQKGKKGDFEKLTSEQRATLAIKKMTLKLDLTAAQADKIKPLIFEQAEERKAMKEKRKALKESGKKLSADERFAMKNAKLDAKIAFKAKMKQILDEKQYEKFEKMTGRKAHKMKKGKKGKRGKKSKNRH